MSLLGKKSGSRWVAGLLLAVYGSTGVLGYGLHTVWDCEHHCHEHVPAGEVVHSHRHDHSQGCHDHPNHGPTVAQSESDLRGSLIATCNDCPICEFLVQAQSQYILEITPESVCLVSTTSALSETVDVTPLLGTHPARGPPLS